MTPADTHDDDALEEAWIEAALELMRRDPVHRLRLLRAAGLVDEHTPRHRVAAVLGISRRHLERIQTRALLKIRHRLSTATPATATPATETPATETPKHR